MKLQLAIVALLAIGGLAYKEKMLETNRVVEQQDFSLEASRTCEECEMLVKKVADIAKDPKKLNKLKMLLGMLCHETSYVEECRMFVSQLDVILEKLQPYLEDPEAVCTRFHMCKNNKITAFHKVLADFANRFQKYPGVGGPQIVCDECEFAVKELKSVIENKQWQTDMRDFLRNNICKTLGSYRGFCDLVVDEYLPQFIQQVDAILNDPHQVCVDIHACASSMRSKPRKHMTEKSERSRIGQEMQKFWAENTVEMKNGQVLALSCFECKLMVDEVQEEMIKNRRDIAKDIQDIACYKIVPSNMTDSCNDFLSIYLPTVIQMTIEQATATGICQANKACPPASNTAYDTLDFGAIHGAKCENLKKFESVLAEKLGNTPMAQYFEASWSEDVCDQLFGFLQPTCHTLIEGLGQIFVDVTVKLAKNGSFSKQIHC